MIWRLRCVGIALAALLTTAAVCLAAEPGYGPTKGGVGGGLGYSRFLAADDYSADSHGRPSFSGSFRYVFNKHLRGQVGIGFLWSGYRVGSTAPFLDPQFPADTTFSGTPIKDNYLTLLAPVSTQIQFTEQRGWWLYHLGGGPGVYRVWVENRRKVVQDPLTHVRHKGAYWGFTGELGAERFLHGLTTTSIEGVISSHYIFARRNDQFPSGWNSIVLPVDLRICVNYYFDMVRPKKTIDSGLPPKP